MEGGSANDYDYAAGDPVNNQDLDGQACWGPFRDKKCQVRDAWSKFGRTLNSARAGYALWKNANLCLNRSNPNLSACVSTFFNGLVRYNPFSSSPAYAVLLKVLGDVWNCSSKSLNTLADALGGKYSNGGDPTAAIKGCFGR